MKLAARQSSTKTIADLYRALDRQHAVTITYTDQDGETTVRTVEVHEIRTTKKGGIVIVAMCRKAHAELVARQAAGEDTGKETPERHFQLAGVQAYTLHRIGFVLERTEATTPASKGIVVRSEKQLIARELGRDYLPRTAVTRQTTALAA
ncbi:hypothetical protein ACGFZS_47230 [Streptomyces sp. NPDC048288]|uniref:WYL domain-containing protein n=1 Tax=Streptomyces sp. NPDC048288 TaxID=3365529 RepID=UPI00371241C2